MTGAELSPLAVRGAALYLPVALVVTLAGWGRPDRRRVAGAVVATVWNVVALLALNVVAVRAGWWAFPAADPAGAGGGAVEVAVAVAGVPVELWVGWALLWGAGPVLAARSGGHLVVAAGVLVAADAVLMPLAEPVVVLDGSWWVGEAAAVAVAMVPGLLLGHWTATGTRLGGRVALQVVGFAGMLLFVLPNLVFCATGEGWAVLLGRSRPQLVAAGLVLAPVGATALQAVRELAVRGGGTPVPLDPPARLVTTGPYAYVANPMQLAGSLLLAGWGALLASPAVVGAAAMAVAFSAGFAAWTEDVDLHRRFGAAWPRYRRHVRTWVPRWRPYVADPATVHVAESCDPCRQVGGFLQGRRAVGLDVAAAELCPVPLRRITYEQGGERSTGVAAIARSLEHVHLGWAVGSWIARLPGVVRLLQLVTDAVGGGPLPGPGLGLGVGLGVGGEGLEGGGELGERLQRRHDPVPPQLVDDVGREHGVPRMDPADGGHPLVGRAEQLGPPVRRVGEVLGEALVDEQVGDALHGLAGDAHGPGDPGDGQGPPQDGAQDLPPGRGQPDRAGQLLGDTEELAVQPEHGQRDAGQQLLVRGLRGHATSLITPPT